MSNKIIITNTNTIIERLCISQKISEKSAYCVLPFTILYCS